MQRNSKGRVGNSVNEVRGLDVGGGILAATRSASRRRFLMFSCSLLQFEGGQSAVPTPEVVEYRA